MRGCNAENGSYPLLLGRGFLRISKDVADWDAKKSTFTWGPPYNRTKIEIHPARVTKTLSGKMLSLRAKVVEMIDQTNQLWSWDTIKCNGPGLYNFIDDGTLAQWLAEYPHSDDELTIQFMEANELPIERIEIEVHSTYCENPPQLDQDKEDQKSNLEDSTLPSIETLNEELLRDEVEGLAILADDILAPKALYLEIDGTHVGNLNAYLNEAIVRTLEDIQIGHDLPIYPPVPNDWYHGPIDAVHVLPSN
jgi:hypothetical protein